MRYEVNGTVMQTVSIDLSQGEQVYSQTSNMAWMTETIRMETNTGGGIFASIKRGLSGGGLFITTFTADRDGHIAFAPRFPGTIMPVELKAGEQLICRKETFLCAEKSVSFDIAWQQRLGAGFFGGQGFILQRVTGPGTVWLDLSGEVVVRDLAVGERLLVHAGHIGIQSPTVSVDIQMVKGFSNLLFGGEGLFLATLQGPGRVWLQSMPIMHLAEEIARYLPQTGNTAAPIAGNSLGNLAIGGAVGGLLGMLGGDNSSDS